jgi:hypothetical protein
MGMIFDLATTLHDSPADGDLLFHLQVLAIKESINIVITESNY